jgi:uncharacterized protein (DUF2235 family)
MSNLLRNLIVCCDGTTNDSGSKTNVWMLKDAACKYTRAKEGRPAQVTHYEQGVGTRAFEKLRGGAVGYGLTERILGSYGFLREQYDLAQEAGQEIRIFLFGFSRGAYTARRLSGLLNHMGLPNKAADEEAGWEAYKQKNASVTARLKREGRFHDVEVQMVGVWDTVKASMDDDYDDMLLASNVKHGYHAMAIDERRKFFPVLRWNADKTRVQQLWFPGVHSDVGGGYAKNRLSNVALRWMIRRAMEQGLIFRSDKVLAMKRSAVGFMHDSMTAGWELLGENVRKIRGKDLLHYSVRTRVENERANYAPENLPANPLYWEPKKKVA